jgi:hypothetical protein
VLSSAPSKPATLLTGSLAKWPLVIFLPLRFETVEIHPDLISDRLGLVHHWKVRVNPLPSNVVSHY